VDEKPLASGSASTAIRADDPYDDTTTERLLTEYVQTRDPRLREDLARRYDRLVQSLANKFARRGAPIDDLLQMGRIGLLHALDRYDPTRGVKFLTYAVSTVVGEIKHYFRDCTWGFRVPRHLQELAAAFPRVEEELYGQLGRSPTISEMAQRMGVGEEEIAGAMELGRAYQPQSLDATVEFDDGESNEARQDFLGRPDPRMEAVVEYAPLRSALGVLDERKQLIVRRRFFEQWSQTEVARELGISQMHVSRLEREALGQLRTAMGREPER
jgi:RNA polymerase sigma-B factor